MIMEAVVAYGVWSKGNELNMLCATIRSPINPEKTLQTHWEKGLKWESLIDSFLQKFKEKWTQKFSRVGEAIDICYQL